MPGLTPFQTVGPFLHLGLRAGVERSHQPADDVAVEIEGRLLDGQGNGVPDGVLEFWWADRDGKYDVTSADRFARVYSGRNGEFRLHASRPGAVPGPGGALQAPHIAVLVLARGVLTRYVTRIYFESDPANQSDPILALVPAERRDTLVARSIGSARYRFDVVLQGSNETVFFDV